MSIKQLKSKRHSIINRKSTNHTKKILNGGSNRKQPKIPIGIEKREHFSRIGIIKRTGSPKVSSSQPKPTQPAPLKTNEDIHAKYVTTRASANFFDPRKSSQLVYTVHPLFSKPPFRMIRSNNGNFSRMVPIETGQQLREMLSQNVYNRLSGYKKNNTQPSSFYSRLIPPNVTPNYQTVSTNPAKYITNTSHYVVNPQNIKADAAAPSKILSSQQNPTYPDIPVGGLKQAYTSMMGNTSMLGLGTKNVINNKYSGLTSLKQKIPNSKLTQAQIKKNSEYIIAKNIKLSIEFNEQNTKTIKDNTKINDLLRRMKINDAILKKYKNDNNAIIT